MIMNILLSLLLGINSIFSAQGLIIVLIVLLLFGGKKIPELMRGLGKGVKSFKDGLNDATNEMNSIDKDQDPETK